MFIIVCNNVFAFDENLDIVIDDYFEYANISPIVHVYGDTTLQQDFDFIFKNRKELKFEINGKESINKSVTDAVWWVEFSLKNKTSDKKNILLEIADADLHNCQLFIVRKNHVDKSILTGDFFPFEHRPIQHRYFLFPIPLSPSEEIVCYFKADKNSQTLVFHTQLWDNDFFIEKNSGKSLISGILIGVVLVFLSIILLLVCLFYSKTLLYYFFYLLSFSIFFLTREGFTYQFLWVFDNIKMYALIRAIWPLFSLIFLVLIGGAYLERLSISKFENLIYSWTKRIIFFLFPFTATLYFIFTNTPYARMLSILFLSLLLILFIVFVSLLFFITLKEFLNKREFEPLGISLITFVQVIVFLILACDIYFQIPRGPNFITTLYAGAFLFESLLILTILYSKYWKAANEKEQFKLINSQSELGIANALLQGQEQERLRLANDLQYELQPILVQSKNTLHPFIHEQESLSIQKINELLSQAQLETSRISNNITPEFINDKTIEELIRSLCDTVQNSEALNVDFVSNNITISFSKNKKINIYRIVQELLNNVVKHAQATQVKVLLELIEERLNILVEDDGIGISENEKGFNTVKLRVARLGGNIAFEKSELSGLKIEIEVPIEK